jgi:hypothetical protein
MEVCKTSILKKGKSVNDMRTEEFEDVPSRRYITEKKRDVRTMILYLAQEKRSYSTCKCVVIKYKVTCCNTPNVMVHDLLKKIIFWIFVFILLN